MRLQPPGFSAFHSLTNVMKAAGIHNVMSQGLLFPEVTQVIMVEGIVYCLGEPAPNFRLLAILDSFQKQVPQRFTPRN